jgi:ABC-type Fe3+-hydroxamate transport system substrate-binding protein
VQARLHYSISCITILVLKTNNTTIAPQRIVCLVPSLTELVVNLGAGAELVGCTKFCIHPATVKQTCTVVGGTKNVNITKVHALKPDLIIANKEENTQAQIHALQQYYTVHITNVNTYNDALVMIAQIGNVLHKQANAQALINTLTHLQTNYHYASTVRVAYLMWNNPYMLAANNTFIHSMLALAGFTNVFAMQERYPIVALEDIIMAEPQFILLSSEPFPFKQKHINALQSQVPEGMRVVGVNGELFSWYGNRLTQSFEYFNTLQDTLHK